MSDAWGKVRALYKDYGETVSLLVIDAELKYREFPTIVLNEIRAFTAHISRLANDGYTGEEADEQVRRAARHIVRIKLDLHKVLCLWFSDEYMRHFPRRYRNVPLDTLIIEDQQFQSTYSRLVAEGIKLVRQAKNEEVKQPAENALVTYELALSKFRELEALILRNQHHLDECKRRYYAAKVTEWSIAFIIGFLASMLVQHWSQVIGWISGLFS
ncbi:MAG: hypothetical protein IPL64_13850 [Flavobacteriales bacterium]|nr:hypothetical protein [Flavobacteriales bacterium]